MKTKHFNIKTSTAKIALAGFLLVAGLNSCSDDFLVAEPELDISDVVIFNTPERAEAAISGLYSSSKSGSLFGGRYLIYNDIRAEEFINRTTNVVTGYSTYQFTNDASDSYIASFWSQAYLTINRANIAIEALEANESGLEANLVANFIAEAKFIRALNYFGLVQIFAKPYILNNGQSPGLPLRLTPETGGENNDLARSTVADVYTQILKDLDDAYAGLSATNGSPELNVTRAHKNSATALKVRVLLAKGDFPGVITEGNKLVSAAAPFKTSSGVNYELEGDISRVFAAPYHSSESILSFPMASTNGPGTQSSLGNSYNAGNREYYLNSDAPGILAHAQFGADDDRRTKLTTDFQGTGMMILTKFSGASPFTDYVPIIRYSEVLLNLAEAEAEVGDQDRAKALLEAVHKRSDDSYDFGTMTKQQLIDAILVERRIELLGEGFRSNDIVRRGLPFNSVGAGANIGIDDERYVFPIPDNERKANGAI